MAETCRHHLRKQEPALNLYIGNSIGRYVESVSRISNVRLVSSIIVGVDGNGL